jgi:APA family basic amino acid/polyamine antiporter
VGLLGALGVMVGITIGSGIFRTPTSIAELSGSPWYILLLWGVGGVVSLFGAFTFAELATLYPQSGGVYVFLREGYGRWLSFVFGWTYLLISKPLAAAGIATVMAEHLGQLLHIPMSVERDGAMVLTLGGQGVICGMLVVLTWINTRGVGLSAAVATWLTSWKVLALVAIVVLAVAMQAGDVRNFQSQASGVHWLAALGPIMAGIMWTYDGWADVGSIAGEVREPQRTLPRAFVLGTLLVMVLYIAVNSVYIWMVPLQEMGKLATVAPRVMGELLGGKGEAAVAAVIVLSALGATQGSIMTGARVTFAQARDGLLFRWLGGVHPVYRTPARSLWVQCALSCFSVVALRNFETFAGGFVFTIWIFYGLGGAAIFILRRKHPGPRVFACVGYPVIPAVFVLAAAAMTGLSVMSDPKQTGLWSQVLLIGVPVYCAWSGGRERVGGRAP